MKRNLFEDSNYPRPPPPQDTPSRKGGLPRLPGTLRWALRAGFCIGAPAAAVSAYHFGYPIIALFISGMGGYFLGRWEGEGASK